MSNVYAAESSWDQNYSEATMNRRVMREQVMAPDCASLIGVDGNAEGGLRVFPGFELVRELDFYNSGQDAVYTLTSDDSSPNTGGTFTISITAPNHASVATIQTTAAIAFDASAATIQTALEALSNVAAGDVAVAVSGSGTDLGDAATVMTFTFANGLAGQPVTLAVNTASLTGGTNPTAARTTEGQLGHDATSDVTDFFPVTFLRDADDYCVGFVYRARRLDGSETADIFIDFWDSSSATWTTGTRIKQSVPYNTPMKVVVWARFVYIFVRGETVAMFYFDGSSFVSLGETSDSAAGPGPRIDLTINDHGFTWNTQTVPTSSIAGYVNVAPLEDVNELPGGSSDLFGMTAQDADGEPAPELSDAGNYSFAIRLLDSVTGRRTGISYIDGIEQEDFSDDGGSPVTYLPNYLGWEIVYDSSKFDKAEIYRSVKVDDNVPYQARILHLVKVITLEDFQTDENGTSQTFDPADTDFRLSVWFNDLNDVALSHQTVYIDERLFDEEVPRGGTAEILNNTLYVSNIRQVQPVDSDGNTEADINRRVSQLRWSSTIDESPELFSPSGYYNFSNPAGDAIALTVLAGNIIGFSRDCQYHVRREGRYMRVHELHEGYGIAGRFAHEKIGNMCYFVSDKGVKIVGANAQLEDVEGLNRLVMRDWAGSLNDVTLALDAAMACLFVLNPTQEQAACMWFNTGKLTLLEDMSFTQCRRGKWFPGDGRVGMDDLTPRAFFLQNAPKDDDEDAIAGWMPRVFVPDVNRTRTIGSGSGAAYTRTTMGDFQGDSRWTIDTAVTSSGSISITTTGGAWPSSKLEGLWVYVLDSSDTSFIGKRAQIHDSVGTRTLQLTDATKAQFEGLPIEGTVLAISPVKFEVVGWPLDQKAEPGETTGRSMMHARQLHSIGCVFSEVSGYPFANNSNDARFTALAYKTQGVVDPARGETYDREGNLTMSVREGETTRWGTFDGRSGGGGARQGVVGNVLLPGIRVNCPDLDFTLLSITPDGKMLASASSKETST